MTLLENGGRNEGPPDLDELWRDFNRKLSGLFGGAAARAAATAAAIRRRPNFQPDMKSAGIGAGLIGGVVVLIWLGSGFFIVQEGQQAVITSFGRYSHTVDAGFNWRLPYPIQRHETVIVTQIRSVEVGRNTGVAGHRPARFVDADRGREHRRHQVHRAVPPEATRAPSCSRTGTPRRGDAGRRDGGARDRRQDARWTRSCPRSATRSPRSWCSSMQSHLDRYKVGV